jgi:hypothetical protein
VVLFVTALLGDGVDLEQHLVEIVGLRLCDTRGDAAHLCRGAVEFCLFRGGDRGGGGARLLKLSVEIRDLGSCGGCAPLRGPHVQWTTGSGAATLDFIYALFYL